MATLTPGAVRAAAQGGAEAAAIHLKVVSLTAVEGMKRFSAELSDGTDTMAALLTGEAFAACQDVGVDAVLKLTRWTVLADGGKTRMNVSACEVAAASAAATTPAPAAKKARLDSEAPMTVTPPSAAAAGRRVQPIEALNPYQSAWTIRVRASGKGALRTVKTARGETKVFSVELTDEQGTTIQATAWREAADMLHPVFEDGQAYYVSHGQLKPANLKYSSCTYMYELSLNEKTVVEPCGDAVMAAPVLRYDFVPFDALGTKLGSKAAVDVLGVVTHCGELGSVARKSDGAALARRDLTLLDKTARTVKLTLWNALAETEGADLAARCAAASADAPVLVAVKGVRVSDYNGVSLSTVGRSALAVQLDELPAAAALRAWYASGGASAATTEAGAGFAGARGAGGGAAGGAPRATFADIQPEALAAADAKPEWATLCGCMVYLSPDATLYYTACPEEGCNKKVTQGSDSRWFCEASQKHFEQCKRRYIMRFKAADASGAGWVHTFDDTGRLMFGCSADELHAMKEAGSARYSRVLNAARFRHWVMKVKTKTEEYNGEARRRITVVAMTQPDWAAQCKAMLAAMAA